MTMWVGFFSLVIRKDFSDMENLVCFFSLISISDFVRVLRSLPVGTVDTFLR